MKEQNSAQTKLFVCTKPYQYLISRLIKEGYNYNRCDLLVLNHFKGAGQFAEAVRKLRVWEQVFFADDTILNNRNAQLGVLQKLLFYHNWERLLPSCIASYDEYEELYFAHEGVAMEYGLMRQFASQGKRTIIYEEGFGNYISVNYHISSIKRLLKEISHWFDIPGNYLGRLRYVTTILLQRPEILNGDDNPIRKKVQSLPLTLHEFLAHEHIGQEMRNIYPELHSLSIKIQQGDTIAILLGESWWDMVPNREQYIYELFGKINKVADAHLDKIFVKQHPGEVEHLKGLTGNIEFIPKRLPLELIYLVAKGKVKRLYLLTFGSTAALNLHGLFSNECDVKIVVLDSSEIDRWVSLVTEGFRPLADKFEIPYSFVKM